MGVYKYHTIIATRLKTIQGWTIDPCIDAFHNNVNTFLNDGWSLYGEQHFDYCDGILMSIRQVVVKEIK